MNYETKRQAIRRHLGDGTSNLRLLHALGIDSTRDGFIRVRPDDKTPSCKVNKDGSFHDFGSGEHYSDIVSLLYDGYHAFDTLSETMQWLCEELNINVEVQDE